SGEGDQVFVNFADGKVRISQARLAERPGLANYKGREIVIGIRPESFEILAAAGGDTAGRTISIHTDLVEQLGSEAFVHFAKASPPVITAELRELLEDEGTDPETLGSDTKFTARVDADHAPKPGQEATLVVDSMKMHFFDKETGDAIK
ncbi:MAG: hypothetical protein OEM66_01990, partial [Acidimicrobiia bacterium]|nr:hypothetical protein [Acidimicrobiia bacterium]